MSNSRLHITVQKRNLTTAPYQLVYDWNLNYIHQANRTLVELKV